MQLSVTAGRSTRLALGILAVSAFQLGCSKESKHAPLAEADCQGASCRPSVPGGSGGLPDAGSSPPSSDGGFGDAGSTTLTGSVGLFTEPAFEAVTAFLGTGRIGVTGPNRRVAADFDGADYTINGADSATRLWVDLEKTSGTQDAIKTITSIDGTLLAADVSFGSTSVLAAALAGLLTPQVLEPGRAQVVLRFVKAGTPVAGVKVSPGLGTVIAYDEGATYSEAADATQARGTAVIVNAVAGAFPGIDATVAYEDATQTAGAAAVKVAQDAVTFATIEL